MGALGTKVAQFSHLSALQKNIISPSSPLSAPVSLLSSTPLLFTLKMILQTTVVNLVK